VPMLVIAVPTRQIAALLTIHNPMPQYDPYAFGRNIQNIVEPLRIGYVDATSELSRLPHSDHLFYAFDHHLTAEGNAVLARALIRKCLAGDVPAFNRAAALPAATRASGFRPGVVQRLHLRVTQGAAVDGYPLLGPDEIAVGALTLAR
jgi:hypothetical protein